MIQATLNARIDSFLIHREMESPKLEILSGRMICTAKS